MKKSIYKILGLVFVLLASFSFNTAQAVICSVQSGCTGIGTLTGIPYGTGTVPFGTVTVGSGLSFIGGTLAATGGTGTVTSVSVVSANGLVGTVATATTTPAITLSTSITGILKGNGTAISAATAGTDYVTASSTNTFTNKTYDTADTGNSFLINGLAATANTGTGAVVRATSPTLITPALGTPSAIVLTNGTGLPISTGVSGLGTGIATFLGTPSSANLASAVTDETGSGALVFATSPTFVTPALGTPSSGTLTNATGLPISTGVSGLGTGVATFLGTPSSANLATAVTDETGSGALVFATSPSFTTPTLGAASASGLTLSSITGSTQCLHVNSSGVVSGTGSDCGAGGGSGITIGSTGITSGTNTRILYDNSGVVGEYTITGTGTVVAMQTSPTFITPALGTPSSGTLTNATGLPISSGVSGLGTGVATFLATPSSANLATAVTDETGSGALVFATSPTLVTPALGTPSALVGTNITGTGSSFTSGSTNALKSASTTVDVSAATAPSANQVLTATSSTAATWQTPTGVGFTAQDIGLPTATNGTSAYQITSSQDGTVMYVGVEDSGATSAKIYRLLKDTVTGNYYITHSASLTTNSNGFGGIAATSSFLYVQAMISGTNTMRRYALADLSGVTSMTGTLSGSTNSYTMWSDGTNLYIQNGAASFDKYTISGTALTNTGGVSFTSSATSRGAISNGTNVWLTDGQFNGSLNIRKYAVAGGAVVSTTSPTIYGTAWYNGAATGTTSLFIGASNILGFGWTYDSTSAIAITGGLLHLMGITLP